MPEDKSTLLCLKCRNAGHRVKDCHTPWPAAFPLHKWAFSPERIEFLNEQRKAGPLNSLCTRCRELNILTMLQGDLSWKSPSTLDIPAIAKSQHYRNLGRVSDVALRRDCPLCVCLFALAPSPWYLEQDVHVVTDWSIHRLERLVNIGSHPERQFDKCILVDLGNYDGEIDLSEHYGDALGLLRSEESGFTLNAQIIHPHEVDLNVVKQYLSSCERLHPITCSPKRSSALDEIFLIDVESRTLIAYPGDGTEYLALSYVWGYTNQVHFSLGQLLPKLPRTIEDAISLTQKLEKRYLWVDMVCIDQNNFARKLRQIQRMGDIYRGAFASIVALSGSSMHSGLPRLEKSMEGNTQPQLFCDIDGKKLIGLMPTLSRQTHESAWGERGWTLQEALLSCRCIYFSQHQVYFECNAMQCSESLDEKISWIHQSYRGYTELAVGFDSETFGSGTLRNSNAGKGKPKDPLQIYGVLVTLFSYRKLTHSSDVLYAFSAILQHLQELSYKDGFYWGLPEADINWCLLWCGQSRLKRRPAFPSWFWAGWEGAIWPGWPIDIYDPQKFCTHFIAWKFQGGKLIQLFPPLSLPDKGHSGSALFHHPTVFDTVADRHIATDFAPESFLTAEEEGYLFLDCAVCSLQFKFGSDRYDEQSGPRELHDVIVNGVSCYIRSVGGTLKHSPGRNFKLEDLALVARERSGEETDHHFLQLGFRNDGIAVRRNVFSLVVHRDQPEALDIISVVRRKVILA